MKLLMIVFVVVISLVDILITQASGAPFFWGDMAGAGSFSQLGSIPQISLKRSHIAFALPSLGVYSRGVLGDGAVTGELPAAGDVVDGHFCPPAIDQMLK